MKIIEVTDQSTWKLFHRVPHRIYGNDPNWICPLESDVQNIFDPAFNKYLKTGKARAYVLLDDQGQPAGRIGAFIDYARNEKQNSSAGGIGYFECIENEAYAEALFNRAEDYLTGKGMNIIDGPISLGERDRFWGLLVKGYDKPPYYQENYHPRYYKAIFERQGYRPFEQILTLTTTMDTVPVDRFRKISKRVLSKYDIRMEFLDLKKIDKYASDAAKVYNQAFKHIAFFQPLSGPQIIQMFETIKPILEPKMICFAYYNGEPIAFNAIVPEINLYLKGFNGKMNWWKTFLFFWKFRTKKKKPLKGVAFGIHPDHQNKGVYAVLVDYLHTDYTQNKYGTVCVPTIRGHNKTMVKTTTQLGAKVDRVHVTYRKILDPNIPFEPFDFYEGE